MAKLKKDPIKAVDLAAFVQTESDFDFEVRVLAKLQEERFECAHSGTYRDPVTGKIRQFDIRARMDRDDSALALAVECKNLHANNPLLVSAVPRSSGESFHDVLVRVAGPSYPLYRIEPAIGKLAAYKPGELVAKRTNQVGLDNNGEFTKNDEATFDKLNQAINSCQDLIRGFATKTSPPNRRMIVPVLVVPTGLLWQVDYGPDGEIIAQPRPVSQGTLFFDHEWSVPTDTTLQIVSYRLSHIEILTFAALTGLADQCFGRFFHTS